MAETSEGGYDWRAEQTDRLQHAWPLAQLAAKGYAEGPESLTDEELERVSASEEEIGWLIREAIPFGSSWCRTEVRRRQRRVELAEFPTEELQAQYGRIINRRQSAIAADYNDSLPDSFFESPRRDSDESIIYELLTERAEENTQKA